MRPRIHVLPIPVLALLLVSVAACAGGPRVKWTADYRPASLAGQRVLIVRLAASHDFVDERSGVTLSANTRSVASSRACARIAESWSELNVTCFDRVPLASSPAMAELERLFALDKPIPGSVWQSIREHFAAEYAILFRPESVASSRHRATEIREIDVPSMGTGMALATAELVLAIMAHATRKVAVVHSTSLQYTLSASLVDMRTGKLLQVGVHMDGAARQVERDLGFAEAPPAAPILEEIMVALAEEMLEE